MAKLADWTKNLSLVAVILIAFATASSFAEEITLTTIMPEQRSRWTLDEDNDYLYTNDPAWKVGIGTVTPSMRLEVDATGTATPGTPLLLSGNNGCQVAFSEDSGETMKASVALYRDDLQLRVGGTGQANSKLTIKPTGNVHIKSQLFIGGSRTYHTGVDQYGYHWLMSGGTVEGVNNALGFIPGSKIVSLHSNWTLYAQNTNFGDITFRKDGKNLWRMFEDEDGLYLEKLKTGQVYSFVLQEIEKK